MKSLKKDLACNISLIVVLMFTFIHLLLLTFNLFNVTSFALPEYFNYIFAYVLVGISLLFYILSFLYSAKINFDFPSWLKIMFYFAFFMFTNTYYILGWFEKIWAIIILFVYVSFIISIASLSIFYNAQKDEGNRLKASAKFIISSTALYSLGFQFVLMFLVQTLKVIAFGSSVNAVLKMFVIESASMIGVTIIVSIIFYLSLIHNKSLINACLVRYDNPKDVKKSVKNKKNI